MDLRWAAAAMMAGCLACTSGAGEGTIDADAELADDGASDSVGLPEPEPPAPPTAPAPAVLTPCPPGWSEVALGDDLPSYCEPWPSGGPGTCAPDEAWFPGEAGCARLGTPCPAGEWPEDLPTDRAVAYVRAGSAPTGGDGSAASPFGTIEEALAAATAGAVLALGRGLHDGEVKLRDGVTLWGACVAETVLRCGGPSSTAGVVTAVELTAGLRNLTIGTSARPGIWANTGSELEIADVVVTDVEGVAVLVAGVSRVTARNVVLRDTRPFADSGTGGVGASVEFGSTLDLRRAVLARNVETGLQATGRGAHALLADVAVQDTRARSRDGVAGRALLANTGARVEAVRTVLERSREEAVLALGPGVSLAFEDVLVRDTEARASDGGFGFGLNAFGGATLTLRRTTLANNRTVALSLSDDGVTLSAEDLVIAGTRCREAGGSDGTALRVLRGATATLRRAALVGNRTVAIMALDEGSLVDTEDLWVTGTEPPDVVPDPRLVFLGRAAQAGAGSRVALVRAVLARNHEIGAAAGGPGARLELTDTTIVDTQPRPDGKSGFGVWATDAATVVLERVVVERSLEAGMIATAAGSLLTARDVAVRDIRAREFDRQFGRGLIAQDGARVELERVSLDRTVEVGVFVAGTGTTVSAVDLAVRDAAVGECAAAPCEPRGGMGFTVLDGAVELRRFLVTRSAACDIQLARNGAIDLHDGVVSDAPIGVNVQIEGYDVGRLTDGVAFLDNGRNLDSADLPVPDATAP